MLNDNKAGMEGLDKEAINKLIYQASKGSLYFEREEQKQDIINKRIQAHKLQLSKISEIQMNEALKKADIISTQLKSEIDLSRVIVHVDMDAFFAAVEILDRPELKNIPMAVGSQSMLSTSNYPARRFGVRAAMPGFIAKKLCPSLVILPPDFRKYELMSNKVKAVLQLYDAHFSAVGLDEAYLDITKLIDDVSDAEKITNIVNEMRSKIFEATNLTASAGIAANGMLAKICSDKNKPNGQFYLPHDYKQIMSFIEDLPVRKVNGIGKVTEMILKEFGVVTCSDLYRNRATLLLLHSEDTFRFFMRIAHAIGSTYFEKDSEKKSISAERTFSDISTLKEFTSIIKELAEQVSDGLIEEGLECKTITLKMKTTKFEVKTRARSLQDFTNDSDIIYTAAFNLLKHEMQIQQLNLRLIGVRASTLQQSMPNRPHKITDILPLTSDESKIVCPICECILPTNQEINNHVDSCLNKSLIKDIICTENSSTFQDNKFIKTTLIQNSKNDLENTKKRKRSVTKSSPRNDNLKISQFYKSTNNL